MTGRRSTRVKKTEEASEVVQADVPEESVENVEAAEAMEAAEGGSDEDLMGDDDDLLNEDDQTALEKVLAGEEEEEDEEEDEDLEGAEEAEAQEIPEEPAAVPAKAAVEGAEEAEAQEIPEEHAAVPAKAAVEETTSNAKTIALSQLDEDILQIDCTEELGIEMTKEELDELLKCKICNTPCNRGVSLPCCGTQACRACATKKVTLTKQCWECGFATKTDNLVNCDILRKAVILHSKGKAVAQDVIEKIQARGEKKPRKTEKKVVSLPSLKSEFETGSTKIYMTIEFARTRFAHFLQVGCLNSKTGETLFIPFAPTKAWLEDTKLQEKLHLSKEGDGFKYTKEDGQDLEARGQEEGFMQLLKFMQCACVKYSPLTLVLYSKAEHHHLVYHLKGLKEDGDVFQKTINKVLVYESCVDKKLEPLNTLIKDDAYSADVHARLLREAFDRLGKKEALLGAESIRIASPAIRARPQGAGMLIFSACKLDTEAWFKYNEGVVKTQEPKEKPRPNKHQQNDKESRLAFVSCLFTLDQPALYCLPKMAETTASVEYDKQLFAGDYTAKGSSQVLRTKDKSYAFLMLRSSVEKNSEQSAPVTLTRPQFKLLKKATLPIKVKECEAGQTTQVKDVKVDLVLHSDSDLTVEGFTSVLVDLSQPAGKDEVNFTKDDVFFLSGTQDPAITTVTVLNEIFTVVGEGPSATARLVLCAKGQTKVELKPGTVLGKATRVDQGCFDAALEKAAKMENNIKKVLITNKGRDKHEKKNAAGASAGPASGNMKRKNTGPGEGGAARSAPPVKRAKNGGNAANSRDTRVVNPNRRDYGGGRPSFDDRRNYDNSYNYDNRRNYDNIHNYDDRRRFDVRDRPMAQPNLGSSLVQPLLESGLLGQLVSTLLSAGGASNHHLMSSGGGAINSLMGGYGQMASHGGHGANMMRGVGLSGPSGSLPGGGPGMGRQAGPAIDPFARRRAALQQSELELQKERLEVLRMRAELLRENQIDREEMSMRLGRGSGDPNSRPDMYGARNEGYNPRSMDPRASHFDSPWNQRRY